RYREREIEAAQLQASLTKAQLHALELQLQPHFLFNTLNAVASLVRTHKNDEAVTMIAGLSDILRYTLDHEGSQRVTVEAETEMLRRYLDIQRTRFAERMTYTIAVQPAARPRRRAHTPRHSGRRAAPPHGGPADADHAAAGRERHPPWHRPLRRRRLGL